MPLVSTGFIKARNIPCCCVDELSATIPPNKGAIITNTDVSSGPGIHWITIYRINQDALIIDPLGPRNLRPYDAIMFAQLHNARVIDPEFYDGRFQYKADTTCGLFAIVCAEALRAESPESIEQAAETINHVFGQTADIGDAEYLAAYFGIN